MAKNGLEDRNQSAKLYLWGDFRENLRGSECDSECESESEDVLMDVRHIRITARTLPVHHEERMATELTGPEPTRLLRVKHTV